MKLAALRDECAVMLAAEKNSRKLGIFTPFCDNPVWIGRKDYLRSVLRPERSKAHP